MGGSQWGARVGSGFPAFMSRVVSRVGVLADQKICAFCFLWGDWIFYCLGVWVGWKREGRFLKKRGFFFSFFL